MRKTREKQNNPQVQFKMKPVFESKATYEMNDFFSRSLSSLNKYEREASTDRLIIKDDKNKSSQKDFSNKKSLENIKNEQKTTPKKRYYLTPENREIKIIKETPYVKSKIMKETFFDKEEKKLIMMENIKKMKDFSSSGYEYYKKKILLKKDKNLKSSDKDKNKIDNQKQKINYKAQTLQVKNRNQTPDITMNGSTNNINKLKQTEHQIKKPKTNRTDEKPKNNIKVHQNVNSTPFYENNNEATKSIPYNFSFKFSSRSSDKNKISNLPQVQEEDKKNLKNSFNSEESSDHYGKLGDKEFYTFKSEETNPAEEDQNNNKVAKELIQNLKDEQNKMNILNLEKRVSNLIENIENFQNQKYYFHDSDTQSQQFPSSQEMPMISLNFNKNQNFKENSSKFIDYSKIQKFDILPSDKGSEGGHEESLNGGYQS